MLKISNIIFPITIPIIVCFLYCISMILFIIIRFFINQQKQKKN